MENENETQQETESPVEGGEESSSEKLTDTVERLEKANSEMRDLLAEQKELAAKNLLGGKSESGEPAEPKEETPQEYKDKVMSGNI